MQAVTGRRWGLAGERGIALLVTLMVLMLVSALMVGFVTAVIADQRASGLERDQTQAYAAAHAGLEQLTSDVSVLFGRDFSPNAAQIAAVRATPPDLPGFTFIAPGGAAGSGYWVEPRFTDAGGAPRPEDPINGSAITSGPYQGLRGIITPYDITVTARSRGNGEVRMRRTLQTVAIPVFQFGMFSETDLSFHAGAEAFGFGGRVHTNGNLFLAAADGGSLTIGDRITSVGDIIRTHLPNGLSTTGDYMGNVRIPTSIAANPANSVYRNLGRNEGSLTGTLPRIETPAPGNLNPTWTGLSVGTYDSNIRNRDTGAKRLDLPLVADLDGNGLPDAQPIELIRRPPVGESTSGVVYPQRFFGQASLRILLSDDSSDITTLPTIITGTAPVSLATGTSYAPGTSATRAPLAQSSATPGSADGTLPASVYRTTSAPLIDGRIKIEMQASNGTWADVTGEILNLGIAGRSLADANVSNPASYGWNSVPSGASDTCTEPSPNAVIRLQRVRDVPFAATGSDPTTASRCGVTLSGEVTPRPTDYWPLALYDTREGQTRDGLSVNADTMALGGIVHYVELDVNNLRRWLTGQIGTTGTNAKNDNGYIVYFSDRRNNNNDALEETGEYGYEDVVNLTSSSGAPNAPIMDTGEDLNGNGTLQTYGRTARNVHASSTTPLIAGALPTTVLNPVTLPRAALVARANRTLFFRRALKIANGGIYTSSPPAGACTPAPCNNIVAPGLTIASENPVYVQGNYNATAASVTAEPNVAAAIIADAVTLLSNNWNDARSFTSPTNSLERPASDTGYRMAIITGKGLAFPQPSGTSSSFGSDGGAHNFVRSLEQWANGSLHRYRGSMVSFFINRQAVGTFKCCLQNAYNRGDRLWSFDTDFLLPALLPPGTPMFRDVNTLTFRQLLRPTQ